MLRHLLFEKILAGIVPNGGYLELFWMISFAALSIIGTVLAAINNNLVSLVLFVIGGIFMGAAWYYYIKQAIRIGKFPPPRR